MLFDFRFSEGTVKRLPSRVLAGRINWWQVTWISRTSMKYLNAPPDQLTNCYLLLHSIGISLLFSERRNSLFRVNAYSFFSRGFWYANVPATLGASVNLEINGLNFVYTHRRESSEKYSRSRRLAIVRYSHALPIISRFAFHSGTQLNYYYYISTIISNSNVYRYRVEQRCDNSSRNKTRVACLFSLLTFRRLWRKPTCHHPLASGQLEINGSK